MQLGIGMFGDMGLNEMGKPVSAQQKLQEILMQVQYMDSLGIDFFALGEHHRPDYVVSSPEIVLAAAASITKQIQLCSGVAVLSSADPVRLYQNYASIDLISNGRAELMVGRGSFIESFPLFGYNLNDYDALFEEKLDLLLAINQQETISWEGKFRPALVQQKVLPRAANQQLKISVAVGGTPESVIRAAKLGLPVMFAIIGGQPAYFKPLFNYYKEVYEHYGHAIDQLETGVHMHCFFGKDSAATVAYHYPIYAAQMDRVGSTRGWPPYQQMQYNAGRQKEGALIIGDANEAIDKILQMHELFGLQRFCAHMDVGGPDHNSMMQSIEIYGGIIAPAIRKALATK